ncbi:MAG: ParB/RepB/Spo0J family partition protein [Tannerella sp.]|jgi:ParB family chromosome partitioning protein|nr:ParB/RepB/Spo0J family partition protein [Tannerella sp.]
MAKKNRPALRGLEAVLPSDSSNKSGSALLNDLITPDGLNTGGSSSLNTINLDLIDPNPDQPRTVFDEDTLAELAASIRTYGIIQPITVKESDENRFFIIAGERRFRAAKLAGLESIPAYVRTANDENVREMALIENIQREDLSPIETALAYKKLLDESGDTQEAFSIRIGKKRATIANYLRLLNLPAEIQVCLKNKNLDMGHARALLAVEDPEIQLAINDRILKEGLSVRAVEELVRYVNETGNLSADMPDKKKTGTTTKTRVPEEFEILKQHLSKFFDTKVQFSYNSNGKGKITIPFDSEQKLEYIMTLLDRMK